MNNFHPTPREQLAVRQLQATMIAPLDYPDTDAWRRDVLTQCKSLVGADKATLVVPVNGTYSAFSEEVSSSTSSAFPTLARSLDEKFSMWERQVALGVWSRDLVWRDGLRDYLKSPYYNEYIVPGRLHDAVGISCRVGASSTVTANSIAGVWLHHERATGRRFGARGLRRLEAQLPAFTAGVGIVIRLGAHRNSFNRLLDGLSIAMLVVHERGETLHRTPALEQLLANDPESPRLLTAMACMAGDLHRVRAGVPVDVTPASRNAGAADIRTASGVYRLRGSTAGPELLGAGPVALVTIEPVVANPFSVQQLAEQFGLTRAQGEVALLLGAGKNYQDIAQVQGISTHTARRHAEQVRVKLGAHNAAGVAAIIARGTQRLDR